MSWQTYIYALGFLGNLLIILVGPNIHNKFVNSIFNYIKRTNCVYVKPCSTIESKCPPKIMFNLNLNCVHVYKCVGISILWTHLAYTCHMCFNVIKLTINGCSNNVHASSKVGEEFKATMGLLGEQLPTISFIRTSVRDAYHGTCGKKHAPLKCCQKKHEKFYKITLGVTPSLKAHVTYVHHL